jgi:hypothetical protein
MGGAKVSGGKKAIVMSAPPEGMDDEIDACMYIPFSQCELGFS